MDKQFERFSLLVGENGVDRLSEKKVAVFGLGGVGSYVVEALVRSGIGHLLLVDSDVVDITNINRQLPATHSNIGKRKTEILKERMLDINPNARIETRDEFYLPEKGETYDFSSFDYVVDAIDTVTAKIDIIVRCKDVDTPIISSMGTGNKLNPEDLRITDIHKTEGCPLARVMRKELRERGIKELKVVYSIEKPIEVKRKIVNEESGKLVPGSSPFVPPVAGYMIASVVVKDLLK